MESDRQRYYAALAASAVSTLAWLGALVGVGYTLLLLVTGRPFRRVAVLAAAAILAGIVFAKTEAALYDFEGEQ